MIEKFFTEIFPADTSYKLIWTLEDKKSHWFQNVNNLIKFVAECKGNTFFGTGVTDVRLPTSKRASANQVTSVKGFHTDIDVYHKLAHKAENLPKTIDEAMEMAHSIIEPTFVLNSGHGLQPHYFFNDHQEIDNFDYWTLFLQSFQRAHAAKYPQYTLDATHDLSRVLRCPGTMNCKDPDDIIECNIIEHNDSAYYEREEIEDAIGFDFKEALSQQAFSVKQERDSMGGTVELPKTRRLTIQESHIYLDQHKLVLDPMASIPSDVFVDLQSMEPEFFREYKNETGRKSASEYQMRLANIAVKCGLNDQNVLDLLIQHRRSNKHPMAMSRADKYVNDMLKAKRTYHIEEVTEKKEDSLSKDDLQDIREYLASRLNIEIQSLWCYNRDPNMYFELELANPPGATVHLGSMVDGVLNQRNFMAQVISLTRKVPNYVNNKIWVHDIVKKLLKLARDGNSPETATYEGQVKVWAREYFIDREVEENIASFLDSGVFSVPFYHKDRVYFSFEALAQWIKTNKGQNIDSFHFGIAMTKNGFIQDSIRTNSGGNIQVWGTPFGYID